MLENLNEAQHAAVTSPSNVIQILAPPGSGKTKTLTSRVAYLLQHHHYKPWNVICLTFTIKSSREMKERLSKLLGNGTESRLILGTFHSVCRRYLVAYGHLIGLTKGFGIADSLDTISIIKRITKRIRCGMDPRKAQSRISNSKSKAISYQELAQADAAKKNVEQHEFVCIYQAYEEQLAKSNLLDYDDLLLRCVDLLRQHPGCVANVEAVLIDEFQDTNLVQFDLMRLFACKHKRVTTVGDPDQSIYGWRSAEIKNLKRMRKLYPDTLVVELQNNYRSSAAILLAAHEVIEQDESRHPKPILPTHCPGTVPVLRRLPSSDAEASWIVSEIQRAVALTGKVLVYSDFAILLRSASLSRQIESAMGRAGIPYRMVGGLKFFDRVEVKILLDYLRIISQPHNNDALARIINTPSRGVGPATAKSLLEEAEAKKTTLWTLLREAVQGHSKPITKISKAAEGGMGTLVSIVITTRNKMLDSSSKVSPEDLLRQLIKKLAFEAYLKKTHAEDHEARWANIEELVAQATEYSVEGGGGSGEEDDNLPRIEGLEQEKGNAAEDALSKFLANVALATELQREEEDSAGTSPQSQVTISTIHAAKGLEWPVVFVPSAYKGCIPHSRAENTDEERRLLYVAMTRPQALLYMSCPTKDSKKEETILSPFLSTKEVGQYTTNVGPSINATTVNDLCRILSRDGPEETQIIEASKTLTSHHDDLWPLNDEEDLKAIASRKSKWDNSSYGIEACAKRRRLDIEDPNAMHRSLEHSFSTKAPMMTSIGSTTTMQSSSTFSYGGFVSATSQLDNRSQQGESTASKDSTSSLRVPKDNGKPDPQDKDRETLMSYWGKGATSNKEFAKSLGRTRTEDDILSEPHTARKISDQTRLEKGAVLNVVPISHEDGKPIHRTPLSTIPQSLSVHRLPTVSNVTRPRPACTADDPTKKQYVFLSSSPPQSEEQLVEMERRLEDTSRLVHENSVENLQQVSNITDIGPAVTFHTTSMIQLQSRATMPKKTLGVRRSMNGWAARPKQGFSVPKMAGSNERQNST